MLKHMKNDFKGLGQLSLIEWQYFCFLIYNSKVHLQYCEQNFKNAQYFQKANNVSQQM